MMLIILAVETKHYFDDFLLRKLTSQCSRVMRGQATHYFPSFTYGGSLRSCLDAKSNVRKGKNLNDTFNGYFELVYLRVLGAADQSFSFDSG